VLIAGEERGTTPTKIRLARADAPVVLELDLPGYERLSEPVIPNVDQRLSLSLSPASRAPGARRVAPAVPSASSARYRKFN
jgi:hypothetical protein